MNQNKSISQVKLSVNEVQVNKPIVEVSKTTVGTICSRPTLNVFPDRPKQRRTHSRQSIIIKNLMIAYFYWSTAITFFPLAVKKSD